MELNCDLCENATPDQALHLMQRCHFTAPLMARIEAGEIVLTCYIPSCGREVFRARLQELPA